MADHEVRKAADDFADAFSDEAGFGTALALLWLIAESGRHVVALAIMGAKRDDAAAGELLRGWAEPQLVAFRRNLDVPMISWRRVAGILRDRLPAPACGG